MKIYVAAVEALRKKESHDETEFTSKIGGKTSLGSQRFCFIKFSFPVTRLLAYDAETDRSNSTVQSFRGGKRTGKVCVVYLCEEVNDYRRSYLQNCGLESYKLQNVLGTSVMHACKQASKQSGSQKF
jgi:hypothetical protein